MNSKATNINETRISSWPAGGTDSFEIMHTNAGCLSELEVVVNSLKPKLIAITEVKHKSKWHLCDSELQLPGYNFFSNDLGKDGRGWLYMLVMN